MRTFALAALLLSACASAPLPINRPAGPTPSDSDAVHAINAYLARTLKDPESVRQFRLLGPPRVVDWYPGFANGGGGGHEEAWLYCFEYNAKNSYGAYVGVHTDAVGVRRDEGGPRVVVTGAVVNARCP